MYFTLLFEKRRGITPDFLQKLVTTNGENAYACCAS